MQSLLLTLILALIMIVIGLDIDHDIGQKKLSFRQTVWTHLGVLRIVVKQLCLDHWGARTSTANSLLFTIHSCLSKQSTCISTAQAREIWGPAVVASSRLRSRCGAARIFAHGGFSWQVQGKPCVLVVQCRLFVTGVRDRSGFTSKCRFRFTVLWTWS